MTIAQKIKITCTATVALTAVLGTAALISVRRMDRIMTATVSDAMPGIYQVGKAERAARDVRNRMTIELTSKSQDLERLDSEISNYTNQFKGILKEYDKTVTRPVERESFGKIEPAFDRYVASWPPIRALLGESKTEEAQASYKNTAIPLFDELIKVISDDIDQNNLYGAECTVESANAAQAAYTWIWINLAVALIVGAVIALYVTRGINAALKRSVDELSEGAEQVASAAAQVSAASQATAQGASEQASSLEETSASAQEISSMTKQNATNSRSAAEGMQRAEQRVVEANRTLEEMIASMNEINESSHKISKIIKVIDEIAFQTNILALNAAVEAARAGEAGMGFAVVADEVRNLAQRSAQAAKDTASLIEESVAKSSEGSTKLESVAAAIRGVTDEASKVKTLVDEVTAASSEQTQGMDQISKAIAEMERVTQRNAANSEESASAGEELNAQAARVKEVVASLRAMVQQQNAEAPVIKAAPVATAHPVPASTFGAFEKSGSHNRAVPKSIAEHEIPFEEGAFKELV